MKITVRKTIKGKKINRLNIGCGNKKIPGYIGVDLTKTNATDILHDLNRFPYPFQNNSIQEILLDNVIEHLDNVIKVIEELHRILIKNGKIIIRVPYAKSDSAFVDPTHKHFFTEKSFNYFTDGFSYSYYTKARFHVKYNYISNSINILQKIRNLLPFRNFFKFIFMNMYDGIEFILIKK